MVKVRESAAPTHADVPEAALYSNQEATYTDQLHHGKKSLFEKLTVP
jgi:hypothetical protein